MSEVEKLRHIVLRGNGVAENFTPPVRGSGGKAIPDRNRSSHGSSLLRKVQSLEPEFNDAVELQQELGIEDGLGLQIEFESFADVELAFESLARERSGIELRNVRFAGGKTLATVFVPDRKLTHFEKLVEAYLDPVKDKKKGPAHHKLINAIRDIRAATVDALWTDTADEFPNSENEELWWEVWLPVRTDRTAVTQSFRTLAREYGFILAEGELQFPERTIVHMFGSLALVKRSMLALNSIAELRRAKETADFFDALPPEEQPEWVDDLLSRIDHTQDNADVPHVCVLDTGVNNGHPLLQPFLSNADRHTVEPAWGVDDRHGHGSEVAGLAVFGDLVKPLIAGETLRMAHRLESVKLLPSGGTGSGNPSHHGYLTVEAVQRPLVTAPSRKRVFYTSVTAEDGRDRGRPSAWSSAIDRLSSDAEALAESPKLFVLAAGNIVDPNLWAEFPESNSTEGIHDPAQAWNALTVGAMTDLTNISEDDAQLYEPIASEGDLSPFSTSSQTWQAQWPLKPDIVMEGGNAAHDGISAVTTPSLRLLTTSHEPATRMFTTTNATSAASALAANLSAQLMAVYGELWAETIRGLIVHSAEWTPPMLRMFIPGRQEKNKTAVANLIRHCGFGVPSLDKALWSATDSLTLISQSSLHPFRKDGGKGVKYREMNFHELPWPVDELESLGSQQVEMRVTLSYFIEPNPSARGVTSRYRYESHGLRFDVKRSAENDQQFKARLNKEARDEEERTRTSGGDDGWMVGKKGRHRGSLHSDIWRGTAADLASRAIIGVYPSPGWWRTRPALERYDSVARYALLISIHAEDVDIYTPVANQIGLVVEV